MNLAKLSIERPALITSIVLLMLAVGYLALRTLPVDLFPNVSFPVVFVTTPYPGAGPKEMEQLVSKVMEDELSSLAGVTSVTSVNKEGVSNVIVEFTLETEVKYAEQQVRDRVAGARRKLPTDIKDPVIRILDPSELPIVILSVRADLPDAKLYDLAKEVIRPQIEQVPQVGLVEVIGGRRREIKIELDRDKLLKYEIPASLVAARVGASGQNVPVGKVAQGASEMIFRTLGEYSSLDDISKTVVNFVGNDVPVTVGQIGRVVDSIEDEKSRAFVNGNPSLFLMVFRQSGANTVAVGEGVKKKLEKVNALLASQEGKPKIELIRDRTKYIRVNLDDVQETIFLGIVLTIIVVFLFLGNVRSTIITGLALPNSLLGAFVLMKLFGFSINVMTLLALSLAVGLLIDDAIVVRENIFRLREKGLSAIDAALTGTREVTLAVVATTLVVIAVFGPVAFLQGVVGQFFKQFGLTICFAMAISLFDAMTIAPMLSAYFAGGRAHSTKKNGPVTRVLKGFNAFQDRLEQIYGRVIEFTIARPMTIIFGAIAIFALSLVALTFVPKTFLPPQDTGEFAVGLDLPPGTSLNRMTEVTQEVDRMIRTHGEVAKSVVTIGNRDGEFNVSEFFIELVPRRQRKFNTSEFKDKLREELNKFSFANPLVKDIDDMGGGMRPFTVAIIGQDAKQLEEYSLKVFEKMKNHPALRDMEMSSKPGKPEFRVVVDENRAVRLGVSSVSVGRELRSLIEGVVPASFRQEGLEYDIRVRLKESQRDLRKDFNETYVPNINNSLVRLSDVSQGVSTTGPANISRQDRGRYIQLAADIAVDGAGMGGAMSDFKTLFEKDPVYKLPEGMRYKFVGQSENFIELVSSILIAFALATFFIYLVLASLYESFVTPLTIMTVLPLAACGAFFALFIGNASLNIFSMIGCVMLMGLATKNSILIVDRIKQNLDSGVPEHEAIIEAGKTRLRPILMTSFALIAGMLPVAAGLNEASKQRTAMGIAIIGGLITSTFLSLVVVPAVFSYFERFRKFSKSRLSKLAN